jgi:energy-coupling factor transporter ATP-binding protein EcfA2
MSELKVVEVRVRDVLGARTFGMQPGLVTILAGSNGSGKSTALQAVQAALGRGSLAQLARVGAEGEEVEPEVVLVLEGGGEQFRVERTGKRVRVRQRVGDTAGFEDIGQPQSFLASLFDGTVSNPVAFLNAKDTDRALMLLEALPLTLDPAQLQAALEGVPADVVPAVPRGLHPLEEVALIRQAVFVARTGVNRDAKGKEAAAEQTRRNAPAVVPEDLGQQLAVASDDVARVAAALAEAEATVAAAEREASARALAEHDQAEERQRFTFKDETRKRKEKHAAWAAEERAEVERRIAAAAEKMGSELERGRLETEKGLDALDAVLQEAQEAARRARAEAETQLQAYRERLSAARERVAGLREQTDAAARGRALHDQAEKFDEEAARLQQEASRLTAAINQLDALQRRLADNLPIEGLEIAGKEIRVHGVPYEQLNTAQRVRIAVQVACLRAQGQRLPVVFVDGAESLDGAHFDALVKELKRQKVQAFVARVEDHELQVKTA